jgi:hypothetical protein
VRQTVCCLQMYLCLVTTMPSQKQKEMLHVTAARYMWLNGLQQEQEEEEEDSCGQGEQEGGYSNSPQSSQSRWA